MKHTYLLIKWPLRVPEPMTAMIKPSHLTVSPATPMPSSNYIYI